MKQKVLTDRSQIRQTESELQLEFVRSIIEECLKDMVEHLSEMQLPLLTECFPLDNLPESYTVDEKRNLRQILEKFQISIIDDRDGGIKIFFDKNLIAEWKKCFFVLKEDPSEIDRSKRIYAEINIETWSIFEEKDNE